MAYNPCHAVPNPFLRETVKVLMLFFSKGMSAMGAQGMADRQWKLAGLTGATRSRENDTRTDCPRGDDGRGPKWSGRTEAANESNGGFAEWAVLWRTSTGVWSSGKVGLNICDEFRYLSGVPAYECSVCGICADEHVCNHRRARKFGLQAGN